MTADSSSQQKVSGPIVDFNCSRKITVKPVPLGAVRFTDRFWLPRLKRNLSVTIPSQYQQCQETGRIDNFRRAAGRLKADFQGIFFNDSDVYKWLEAASYALATDYDSHLDAQVDELIADISAAQQPDGYLNTYYMYENAAQRWSNLRDMHELYCAGHLMQAAVAHHRATGKSSLLEVACRFADHITDVFGPGKKRGVPGHPEIEMSLVELYRATGNRRYLQQAQIFIDLRGSMPSIIGGSPYHQDHVPFREMSEMVGHAVRAIYLNCGAADVYAETADESLYEALQRLWDNCYHGKVYLTGGLGARYEGEAFGADYELPNERAYAETCAAIASFMWNWRMLCITGETRYGDEMETALYNGILSGISMEGDRYFYENPLADRGGHRRQPWFGCACCPPNLARTLASLPGYIYGVSETGLWIHHFAGNDARLDVPEVGPVSITQTTDFPWDDEVDLLISLDQACEFSLFIRHPHWCAENGVEVVVNGRYPKVKRNAGGYIEINRKWESGDQVTIQMPMAVQKLTAHPFVTSNRGRVALRRGPLVYCIEQADHPLADVWDMELPMNSQLAPHWEPDILGGVITLRGEALVADRSNWKGSLYRIISEENGEPFRSHAPGRVISLVAVPYYSWANRAAGPMQVWIPVR